MKIPFLFTNVTKQTLKASWLMPNGGTILIVLLLIMTQSLWAKEGKAGETVSGTSANTISYQGQMTDTNGNPINGSTNMVFKLYSGPSGGTALWTESWSGGNAVEVTDGLFHVMLGGITPIPQSLLAGNSDLWLGIKVGTDNEMTPRIQLGSSPFAFQANSAFGLAAADGDPQSAVYVDANGTVSIETKLTIVGDGSSLWLQNTSSALNEVTPLFWGSDLGAGRFLIFLAGSGYTYNSAWTNDINLYTAHDLDINFITSDVSRMSIDGGGNVGIGTTNPDSKLDVNGNLEVGTASRGAILHSSNSDNLYLYTYTNTPNPNFFIGYGTGDGGQDLTKEYIKAFEGHISLMNANVGIGTLNPQYPLHMVSGAHVTVGGMWTNASDRNLKENLVPINPLWYLEQVAQLPLSTWNYISEGSEISHVGPMAQDFYAAFGLGEDDQHIGTVDANGVALAAIQGLYQLTQDQQTQIESQQETLTQLTSDNAALQEQVTDLEERLTALEQAIQSGQPVQASGTSASWGIVLLGVIGTGVWGVRVSRQGVRR